MVLKSAKSKIREEVLSKLRVSQSLIKLVGTIPVISLEKEKKINQRSYKREDKMILVNVNIFMDVMKWI